MSCLFNCICGSKDENKILRKISSDIKVGLKREGEKSHQEVKILILGTEQAGKSTFVKQMRIIYGHGYDEEERCALIPQIQSCTLLVANALIDVMKKLAFFYEDDDNRKNSELISSRDRSACFPLSDEVVIAINCIWKDGKVQFIYSRRAECDFASAKYFLDSIDRISSPGYIPSDQDILHIRTPATGVEEFSFRLQSITLRMLEVNDLKGGRKKWVDCFDSVGAIIFLASLCEYDQLLDYDLESRSASSTSLMSSQSLKDRNSNLDVSLALFANIVSYTGFANTSFILFLNKEDLFQEKILNSHLSSYYPEYTGPKFDAISAGKFIRDLYLTRFQKSEAMEDETDGGHSQEPSFLWRVSQQSLEPEELSDAKNRSFPSTANLTDSDRRYFHSSGEDIYTHFTSAIDTENIKLVFSSVKDTILRQNFESCLL